MRRVIFTVFIMCMVASMADAQLLNKRGEVVTPYYISFDPPTPPTIQDIKGEFLHISYRDRIGQSEAIKFSVTNGKQELLKELTLVKEFGQNYFDIRLVDHGIALVEDELYICRLTNEKAEVHERVIRLLSKVKTEITATILVKPKQLSCESKSINGDLVEFFGQVSGGSAPYKANWYVLNARRTDFLYEPAHVIVPSAGVTSSVQVDKSPEYYVLLHVTDACGNEQTATVQVVCQRNEKKVNTLFLEKLDDALMKKTENLK